MNVAGSMAGEIVVALLVIFRFRLSRCEVYFQICNVMAYTTGRILVYILHV
jgi:hypothetical protein